MAGSFFKAKPAQQLAGADACFFSSHAGDDLRHDDIFQGRELGQQVMKLVDETDVVPPQVGSPIVTESLACLAADCHRSAIRRLE